MQILSRKSLARFVIFGFVFASSWLASGEVGAAEGASEGEEPPELVTDRPDFTESSTAVAPRWLQLEAGMSFSVAERRTQFAPANVLARYGVAERLELRFGMTPLTAEFEGPGGPTVAGLEDVSVGAKYAGALSEGLRAGVIPWIRMSSPMGETAFSAGAIGTVALEADGPVSVAANLGVGYILGTGRPSGLEGSGSVAAGIDLPGDFGTFFEFYGILAPTGAMDLFADAGVTYMITPRYQLDGYVALAIPGADSVSGGIGLSFLL